MSIEPLLVRPSIVDGQTIFFLGRGGFLLCRDLEMHCLFSQLLIKRKRKSKNQDIPTYPNKPHFGDIVIIDY